MNRGYNYNHYLSQRPRYTIKKCDMYELLDNEIKLDKQLRKKIHDDKVRYKKTCKYLNKVFGKMPVPPHKS